MGNNVLCVCSSTFHKIRMSMLKMLANMLETFCCFTPVSLELQASNCMQNDRMVKAKLFCQKLLSIKSTIRSRQSKTWFVGNVNLNNLLYDHFKHSFESIRVKGTELGTKTFFVGNLFKNFTINEYIVFTLKLCRRRPFGCDLLNSDNWRLDNLFWLSTWGKEK